MRNVWSMAFAALLGCAGTHENPNEPRSTEFDAAIEEARTMLVAGRVDEALAGTDRILAADPDNRAALRLAADGNFALFREGRRGGQFFLSDAIRNLEAALNLDGEDGDEWLQLAAWHYTNSDFERGMRASRRAYREFEAANAPNERKAAAMLELARQQMQPFVEARRAELQVDQEARPEEETTRLANEVLASAQAARELGAIADSARHSARVYRWLGRQKESLEFLERAIVAEPAAGDLHDDFREIYLATGGPRACVGAYRRILRTHGENAVIVWYLGRAQAAAADELRASGHFDDAAELYRDALASFERCADQRAAFRDSCNQWRAICEMSLGRIAFERGDDEAALAHYERCFEHHPDIAAYDDGRPRLWDGAQKHYLGNLFLLGQRIAEGEDGLARGLEYFERIIERHPDSFGTIHNNAALCARDLGVAIAEQDAANADERRANLSRAMELWERSYAHYEKAVELEPNDPRIVNDCGLMLIYHLHRGYDRARECFDRAIELGEAQLAELDESSAEQRQFLEEAVGDAYQNIGVLLTHLDRPASEIVPYYEKAIRFYPGQRRAAAQRLREMHGARDASARPADEPQDPARKDFDARVAPAMAKADAGDWDAALLELDGLAKDMKGYAPYHHLAGLYSLRYAQSLAASGGGSAGVVEGLFQDAVAHLSKAAKLEPKSGTYGLHCAEAEVATGAFGAALDRLEPLVDTNAFDDEQLAKVNALLATSAANVFIKAKGANENDPAALATARKAFRAIEKDRPLTTTELSDWVNVERWDGKNRAAIEILGRATKREPQNGQVIELLVTTGYSIGENAAVVDALASRDDAFGIWYRGKALYNDALFEWSGSKPDVAKDRLDEARQAFEASQEINPDYEQSCREWISFCHGCRGLVELSAEEWDAAHESLIRALEVWPGTFNSDLGSGSTLKRGILVLGDRYRVSGDLRKTADFFVEVGELVPDDVDIANNAGLFARDGGVQLARSGDEETANEYFEASYTAYSRAVRLDPTNVRLRNDCALILVHHLHRELDHARELLEGAVRDGEATLADDPPAEPRDLRDLQEAVGDAHENLGVYYLNHVQDLAKARDHFEKSLTYPPTQRVGSRYLQRIERLEKEGSK